MFVQMFDVALANWVGEPPGLCRGCDVRFACHGGCPKDRFIRTPDGEEGLDYLCAGYLAFFHHIDAPMWEMAGLLAAGRAPSDIVGLMRRRDAARGRNDPCPCGSGRKSKKCHGTDPSPAPAARP